MEKNVELPDFTKNNYPETTKSAVLNKTFDIQLKDTKLGKMGSHDLLIKVMAVGICGSDVHYYDHGRIGDFVVKKPLISGHESSGIVVAVGDEVTKFKHGDKVVMEPGIPCGKCKYCLAGKYNLCPQMKFMATPPVDGDLSQLIIYPDEFTYKIPNEMSYEVGSLSEPLSVGVHAAQMLSIQPGKSVFVSGAGPVGLLAIMAAKAFGASKIIASDAEPERLACAKKMGADTVIDVTEQDVKTTTNDLTNGEGVNTVIEASGNVHAEQDALLTLSRGGKIAYVGMPAQDEIPLNMPFIQGHEIQIFGVFRYANDYPISIEILTENLEKAEMLLTNFYSLAETKSALENTRTNKQHSLKTIIYPNEQLRKNN
ncbi:alcohol dehydrogenase [Fructilactobacillus lindneri]|uniref:L-iditol 2-dehydrogenase n=2 Tax=Fructilactobacillus lindneri TaxID=53444 RepID=A0A0R2JWP7_9LACO|nr:NAD(P)-dependent alcohol dehydrogenase [Fructilactobacillus lindneri]ANZ58117.1 alcohol dehydrogenase [Fructilactobacillus lindneri]ANZ59438.1 alcohol dehydrogenase [Fructilactobacillus lindneri]KRN78935.1 L-iditol 2-dehydrogenase [Fructilactobacillus lindneri DSM 20690 = JCM 11027]POG98778.1 alcohol dehydrogenase [Fructilactobacillus lindneri]POH03051.1 alcohol dehydrogenase [Fructilactobacillus lindneri]